MCTCPSWRQVRSGSGAHVQFTLPSWFPSSESCNCPCQSYSSRVVMQTCTAHPLLAPVPMPSQLQRPTCIHCWRAGLTLASTAAPASSSILATSLCPYSAALRRGVPPSCSTKGGCGRVRAPHAGGDGDENNALGQSLVCPKVAGNHVLPQCTVGGAMC
jgi:hypothetical protein